MRYGEITTETCIGCDRAIITGQRCADCADRASARRAPADAGVMHYPSA